ncbi:MAG TPA: glycoside hydrolase family 2 TIM barrel-domain containing protein [Cytophagaceae bacterium]
MNTTKLIRLIIFGVVFILFINTSPEASTVIKKESGKWKLYVDSKEFRIKGVTFGEEVRKETIGRYLKDLKFLGVNTIRTWGTNEATQILLDSCHAYGIKVMVGIWMRHGRPGMEGDDNFNYLEDVKGMEVMYNDALQTVKKYKDHPAVLFWGVGNEVYLNIATDPEKKAYSLFLEKVCSAIKKEDPNHPIASVEAWTFGFNWWKEYCPSVDIYATNVYGSGANQIPEELTKLGIDKPYVITEFGVDGEWGVPVDKKGLKIEPGDNQKYDVIAKGYKDWIENKSNCLGVYVFHYEVNKGNHGAVWLLLYYNGMYRPQYWATREAFTGKKPVNHVPVINTFAVLDTTLPTGTWMPVKLDVLDVDNDALEISFHYNQRIGSRVRMDQINPLEYRGSLSEGFEVKVPQENGLIKIYAFVKDAYNNLGIAQTSFVVNNGKNAEKLIPGAKVTLPFYVYKDGVNPPYIPTAYMGDYKDLRVDAAHRQITYSGTGSIKITYDNPAGWYGLGFVDPPDDWGDKPGGYDVSGATKFTFWAKATNENVIATFGFGLIGKDKEFYDTERKSLKVQLTNQWKKYEINVSKSDLRCIRSGFTIFGGGIGEPYSIYIDDIMFE